MMINKYLFQRGQALPLALVLLAAIAATVFYMFNTGQLVQEKMGLTNTADAVAYSAGVYEARVLNYDAYTNRAMIANEIAIGQAVGLASWAKYAGTSANNISQWAKYIPYVGPYIEATLKAVEKAMDAILKPLGIAVGLHDGAIQVLKASQFAVHGPGNSIALFNRKVVMDEVAKQNDPDISVDILPISDNFAGFTKRYAQGERARMRDVVERNRQQEDFLKTRRWDFKFGICVRPFGGFRIDFKKRGGTALIGLDGWKSIDTLSAHTRSGSKCKRRERPVGYGSSFSVDGLPDNYDAYNQSRSTNPRATSRALSEGVAWNSAPASVTGGAIPEFYDLAEDALKQKDPRTQITIRVTKPNNRQRYSGGTSIVKPSGSLDLYGGEHQGEVTASIARAEVYFERPDGANKLYNKAELGSLFNPYWQVHLVPVSIAERAQAALLQGFK
jgi:hypothetical protein